MRFKRAVFAVRELVLLGTVDKQTFYKTKDGGFMTLNFSCLICGPCG